MWKIRTNVFLNICIAVGLLLLLYYAFLTRDTINNRKYLKRNIRNNYANVKFLPAPSKKSKDYHIWLIFTKFNIIVDGVSKVIAENQIADVQYGNKTLVYSFFDIEKSARKIQDIVEVMTPHFSSKPGTYYSDALFYISLGLYRIAPQNQHLAILLDCDLYFKKDIALLFNEFNKFKSTAIFGLAPELTPVYRHVLHMYKAKHNTTFGEYYHKMNISTSIHPQGFQGYNSGVVLINLKAQRNSTEFPKIITNSTVHKMTSKYKFRGHLGDQDFYTLMGYEYPHLIQTLNCGFNRQLCTWWRDHGYSGIFEKYFKCGHEIIVLHGNCNTRIPK